MVSSSSVGSVTLLLFSRAHIALVLAIAVPMPCVDNCYKLYSSTQATLQQESYRHQMCMYVGTTISSFPSSPCTCCIAPHNVPPSKTLQLRRTATTC